MNILNESSIDCPSIRLKSRQIAECKKQKNDIIEQVKKLGALDEELYKLQEEVLHIHEIYRLAIKHFPRLKGTKELLKEDVDELEKWIKRAKSSNGLVDIVKALKELERFKKIDIKKNLYALVQKIIIEGPHQKK